MIDDDRDKRLHVEIKPLSNGSGPISASVDELRATVENISLLPIGTQTLKVTLKNIYIMYFIQLLFDLFNFRIDEVQLMTMVQWNVLNQFHNN